jgi:hypothetical protein
MSKNLWGDLSALEKIRTPKSILQEQAGYLSQVTEGMLVAKVDDDMAPIGGTFRYDLDIHVPALNDYVYTLLSIRHPLELYPVQLSSNRPPKLINCADEQALQDAIESILSSSDVKKVLSRLLSQAS